MRFACKVDNHMQKSAQFAAAPTRTQPKHRPPHRDFMPVATTPEHSILRMQRLYGNAAVKRMLQKPVVQRDEGGFFDGLPDFPSLDDIPLPQLPSLEDLPLEQIVDQFAPEAPSIAPNPDCTSDFCAPLSSRTRAQAFKAVVAGPILAGIAAKVNTRVVDLWRQHIFGGSPPQDLSSKFGTDFTTSKTTAKITDNLVNALKADIEANPPTFPPGVDTVTVDIPSRIPAAIAEIGTPGAAGQMDFDVINEIPGNIAGGIGTNQLTTPVGAQPAPFDDSRTAVGTATVTKNPDGTMTITTNITFTVKDTIDLCPGNCGALVEQTATRPLSWLEASGVSGDVPFTVEFAAPTRTVTTNPITPPTPTPTAIEGEVTASPRLRIREAPNTTSPILGRYPLGTRITIECQTIGEEVDGNNVWDKTDQGFVADRYVHRLSPDDPPNC